ncbi:diguanylate cyclase domain-containing protein [Castellaniella sp.]|uniref:diguanylate cyclase domain-containing protein n=1 Tax=Castellaniella sp. TaxID=1955812 RepID=UPI003C7373AE
MAHEKRHAFSVPTCLLIALLSLASIATLWLAVSHVVDTEREQAIESTMQADANLAIAFEQDLIRTLKAAEQVAAFARKSYLLHGKAPDIRGWIKDHTIREHMFTILSVVDAQGRIIASTQDTPPEVNYSDRDFFTTQQHTKEDILFISRAVFGRVSHQWRIPMSLRTTLPDGSFGGVTVIAIDPAQLTHFYRHTAQPRHAQQTLIQVLGTDGYTRGSQIGNTLDFDDDARSLPWFVRAKTHPIGQFITDLPDRISRIISYRTLSQYSMMVVFGTPLDEAMTQASIRHNRYWIATGLATLAVVAMAILLTLVLARQRAGTLSLQASEARLAHAARHDALTGLPNRVLFQERCQRALATAQRHRRLVAILYLDLDGFKSVNDEYGHASGDTLLKQAAQRLLQQVRATSQDTVARFGGDEFAILLDDLHARADTERVIRDILAALSEPFTIKGTKVQLSASIGAVEYPQHGNTLDMLMGHADAAMYAAKKAGKNQFMWWSPTT